MVLQVLVAEHRTFREDRLLPKVRLVRSNFVSGDDACLVPRRAELDLWTAPDHDESVQEVRLDAAQGEPSIVSLEEHHANYIVADMALALQLLRVILLVGQQCGHMEHELDAPPVGVD